MKEYEKAYKKSIIYKNSKDKYKCYSKYLFKYMSLFFGFILILNDLFVDSSYIYIQPGKKYIFTFWEPSRKIPGYLKLCIETWKIFLPEYKIEILDYNKVKSCLGKKLFSTLIDKKMSKSVQADGIRVAILQKYGGIWLDTDTIVLGREFLNDLKNTELAMFGDTINKSQHIGFIYAKNNSILINEWFQQIISNANNYKKVISKKRLINDINWKNSFKKVYRWNMYGNEIVDPLLRNITNKKYYSRLDKYEMNILPEYKYFENTTLDNSQRYQLFYFKKGDLEYIIKNDKKGIILLHNSWTPKKYRKMTAKRFIKQDVRIAKLLSKILNGTRLYISKNKK